MYDNLISWWNGNNLFFSGNLYSSGGSDLVSYSYNLIIDCGFFEVIIFYELFSYREELGFSERCYCFVFSLFISGWLMVVFNNFLRLVFCDDFSLDDFFMGCFRFRLGGED